MQINIRERISAFITQSKRVFSITHKPREAEFKQMSLSTAIGMALIGLIGFAIAMAAHYLRLI